jgi:ribonuclease P/MRP protein subunit POP7
VKAGDAGAGEEVLLKGTGKAVQRVLELGLWFQQREERFVVRLRTGSVGAVDDVEVMEDAVPDDQDVAIEEIENDEDEEGGEGGEEQAIAGTDDHTQENPDTGGVEVSASENAGLEKPAEHQMKMKGLATESSAEPIPETRIRYTSSLEVSIRRT